MRPLDNRLALMISESDEFTKCGLCYRIPGQPVVLDCFHSYCYGCLNDYRVSKKYWSNIKCPLCGHFTCIMDGLRRNLSQSPTQTPEVVLPQLTCDLCMDAREAEGTCLDCSEKLCKFCLESHQNSKASKHHRIKIFGDRVDCVQHILNSDELQVHVSDHEDSSECNNKCSEHLDETLTHFCRMCATPVCKVCRRSSVHKGHRTRPLEAAMSDKRRTLAQRAQNVKDGFLEVLRKKLHNTKGRQEIIRENSAEVIAKALRRAEVLKREIDISCDQVIADIKENEKTSVEQVQKYQNNLEKEILTVGSFIQNLKNLVNVGDDLEMAKTLKTVLPLLEKYESGKSVEQLERTKIDFEVGGLTSEAVRKGFGSVCVKSSGQKWSRSVSIGAGVTQEVNVRVMSKFECPALSVQEESDEDEGDDDPVHAIAPVSESEAWTGSGWETTRIGLVETDGTHRKSLDVGSRIDDMTTTAENDVILSCFREKLIKKLSKNGDLLSTINTPFFPRGVTCCSDGGFLVCMTDNYSTSLASDSRRLVAKYSKQGEIEYTYEMNEDSRLFRRPYRIAQNINADICVSDRTSMGSGRVVVIDRNGNQRFIYEGPSNNQCQRTFAPAGVVCDSFGRILVADTNNHCVHILDLCGQFLGFLLKHEDGLVSPHTLAFDQNGRLWVGDEIGAIRVFEYMHDSTPLQQML